jgi:transglutaminase-like putative cysteine protease
LTTTISDTPNRRPSSPARRRLEVRHETAYRYQNAVSLGYSLAWVTPRTLREQAVLEQHFSVAPPPRFQRTSEDSFGNTCRYFEIHKAHTELRVESRAVVERAPAPDLSVLSQPWEQALRKIDAAAEPATWEFIYPTAMTPADAEYSAFARRAFTPGRPLGEALLAFNSLLHAEFEYLPGATDIDTPLAEVWQNRAGVCQDFAHLAISALRGIGFAVAYVSGYLLTTPREGADDFVGADASHAWFAVWTRELGWVHLDPTNDTLVGDEHIVLAMGRDYSDSPPLKGICFGGGQHQLSVAVTVHEIRIDEPRAGAAAHPIGADAERRPASSGDRRSDAGGASRDGD